MILRQISRQRAFIPLRYGRSVFRRPFQTSHPRWAESEERQTIGQKAATKAKELGQGFIALMVFGAIYAMTPTWDDTLDAICRVVGPKTVAHNALSDIPKTVYNSIHQDPAIRQIITRSDEFRVLVVEPGSDEEAVRCRLVNVAESWRTRYDALSYTWGDENIRDIIIVDGLRTSVTKNLQSALKHLRDPHRERMLWVDALCINQDDTEERDEQVTKMGSIYSGARRVIVWLGEQTEDVNGAFETLKTSAKPSDPEPQDLDWSPVFNLLRRPWFQRTWIIQEAVLGRDPVLACGFETLPWESLSYCCTRDGFEDMAPDDGPELTQALQAIDMITHGRYELHTTHVMLPRRRGQKYARYQKYTPDFKLVSTLYETRGFRCKDVRDKVFGMLSLVTNIGDEDGMLRPNYRASAEEVFEMVARWEIEKNHNLELLSYCTRKESKHPDLPSWAPDFSDIDDSKAISFLQKRSDRPSYRPRFTNKKEQPNIGLERYYRPMFDEENGKTVLILSGVMVDTITRVSAVVDNSRMILQAKPKDTDEHHARLDMAEVKKRRAWFEECVDIALATDPASPNKPQSAIKFWKSPHFGMTLSHWNDFYAALTLSGVNKRHFDINAYSQFLFEGINTKEDWHQQWSTNSSHEVSYGHLRKLAHKRRFCATGTGRIGWVPGSAKEGDLVCLISGAEVPIVLRKLPSEERDPRYSVVGDAYFDGLMHRRWEDSRYYVGGQRLWIV